MYIQNMSCISPQATYFDEIFKEGVQSFETDKLWASEPKYKDIIPMSLLRRMSKLVRMSVATALPLIEKSQSIDGILIGSSNGSVERSLRFLNQIIQYDEGTLTPTDFVQSTPNCVAGILALMGKVTGYNTTHVNQGLSFESAILDALMLFEEGNAEQVIIGAGEELSDANYNIESQRGLYKNEIINTENLLQSNSNGTIAGEGVTMFAVNAEKSSDSLAEIVDVVTLCHADQNDIGNALTLFLKTNDLSISDIDTIFLGRNGDTRNDVYYGYLEDHFFSNQNIFVYKNLTGEYYSAASFAMWLATNLLSGKKLPKACLWKESGRPVKNVLLYNNYEGKQHSFTLMKNV